MWKTTSGFWQTFRHPDRWCTTLAAPSRTCRSRLVDLTFSVHFLCKNMISLKWLGVLQHKTRGVCLSRQSICSQTFLTRVPRKIATASVEKYPVCRVVCWNCARWFSSAVSVKSVRGQVGKSSVTPLQHFRNKALWPLLDRGIFLRNFCPPVIAQNWNRSSLMRLRNHLFFALM